MSSSSRANALASAALASTRTSQTYPRASPVATSFLDGVPYNKLAKGKGRALENRRTSQNSLVEPLQEKEDDIDDNESGLSSRQRRLSRAARYGSSHSSNHISLPSRWNEIVTEHIKRGNTQVLRQDYLKLKKDRKIGRIRSGKLISSKEGLHLTAIAPFRYPCIYSVLRQVRSRLGPDEELPHDREENFDTWSPQRIIEYNCGAGEGLWAARQAFEDLNFSSYIGYNPQTYLIKVAKDFYNMASSSDTSEADIAVELPLKDIKASWKPHAHSPEPISGSIKLDQGGAEAKPERSLVLSSYALLLEYSDDHRRKLIRRMIEENKDAEVLVFIEEATERGFAAIASAREYLLGSDERDQLPKESLHPRLGEWHVVAPCPHDKPCPLLHDYEFAEPPHVTSTRTSPASSPLFHGAALDMHICSFPSILNRPKYLQLTTNFTRTEETVQYSYLVVKKGPRPSILAKARQEADDEKDILGRATAWRRSADKTKKGDIEELRAGTKKGDIQFTEELNDDPSDITSAVNVEMDEILAKEELLKLLPDALKKEMQGAEEDSDRLIEVDQAVKLAQEMMEKSAIIANESQEEMKEEDVEQDTILASAFLDQARAMSSNEEGMNKEGVNNEGLNKGGPEDKKLSNENIEAMRLESYQWPRLIRSGIKRSGHATFDICSCNGSIDRFTIAKSSGKQVYQDARKSSHGDLFPHVPFNDNEEYIVNAKSLITRIPAASSIRSSLPAMFERVRRKPGKEIKMITTPSSAIGPDRVAYLTAGKKMKSIGIERKDHLRQSRQGKTRFDDKTRYDSNLRTRTPFPASSSQEQYESEVE